VARRLVGEAGTCSRAELAVALSGFAAIIDRMLLRRLAGVTLGGLAAALSCAEEQPEREPPGWEPGPVFQSSREPNGRGLVDLRGVIHAHSVHSYDACDNQPKDSAGAIDEQCFDDFRRGICQAAHDFVMLTDHRDSFEATEFSEALLYRPERGDRLVERGAGPVGSWAACPERDPVLILAGLEGSNSTLPVGFERHAAASLEERHAVYGARTAEAMESWRQAGAVVLIAHPEGWSPEELAELPLDGFEIYNVHFNAIVAPVDLFNVTRLAKEEPQALPHPDLALFPFVREMDLYLETWGTVLSRGARRVGTLGTDCHRNSFPDMLPDGERLDSYRRMLVAYSNHLLIRPESDGSWDDRHLKQALAAGRLYGSFDYLGTPVGFDYHALEGDQIREMGEQASLSRGVELSVTAPRVQIRSGLLERGAPVTSARLLRAREGGWDEVARAEGDLRFTVSEPGAYRAEIRIRPTHLAPYLASYAYLLEERDFVWIYGNAIYVAD
jgi:hypothetical protein